MLIAANSNILLLIRELPDGALLHRGQLCGGLLYGSHPTTSGPIP